jgi:DNA-binding MltR family transcriptional regulator
MAKKRLPADGQALAGAAVTFFDALKVESDRGCVLVAAAFLDEALELLLRRKMTQEPAAVRTTVDALFVGNGPLGSFWAKTELGRALQFIPDVVYDDLTSIRTIRNHFAHSYVRATFSNQMVRDLVSGFHAFGIEAVPLSEKEEAKGLDVRQRFCLASSWHAGGIHKETGIESHDA